MKNKKAVIISAVVVVLAITGVLIYILTNRQEAEQSPEEYMARVFANTVDSLARDMPSLPDSAAIKESFYDFSLSAGLKDYKLDFLPEDFEYTMETLKLLTFTSNSKVDRKNRAIANDIRVSTGGVSIIDFNLFFADGMYAAACEKLTERTITINPNTFISEWNDSVLPDILASFFTLPDIMNTGVISADIINTDALNMFIFSDKSIFRNPDTTRLAQLKQESLEFLKSGAITHSEEIDGYNIYTAVYDKNSANALVNSYLEALLPAVGGGFSTYTDLLSGFGLSGGFFDIIKSIAGVSPADDITVTFHVDGNDLIRKAVFDAQGIWGINEVEINLGEGEGSADSKLSDYIKITAMSDKDASNPWSAVITNVLKDSSKDRLYHNLTVDITGGSVSDEAVSGGAQSSHNYLLDYSAGKGDFNLSYAYNSPDNKVDFSLKGQLTSDENSVNFRNGTLNASYNENYISLKTAYTTKKSDTAPVFDDSSAISFFDINVLELGAILSRAVDFLYSF